jgi:predicted enzyme related to lactoylglutathione lyase
MLSRRAALTLAATAPAWSQSKTGAASMPHPVVFFEIGCRDRGITGKFFSDLFGWNITQNGPASPIDTGDPKGIPGHINSLGHEPEHYTMFYVQVDDIKATLDKANELGGKTIVPPIKIPTGTFAWFADLDGNTIGLLQPNK